MELENVVPWGRSFREYKDIFALTENDLKKHILGCGDGPSSFNAELTAIGGHIISVDPVYQFDKSSLKSRIDQVYNQVIPEVDANKNDYVWSNISSVEELTEIRMDAMNIFIDDYENGKEQGRYLQQALPNLNFEDNQFDLALCSHFLFLYSDHFGFNQHLTSVKELCRVAKEVRIYPLVSLDNQISEHLEGVIDALRRKNYDPQLVKVDYEFQKGATHMLVIKSSK